MKKLTLAKETMLRITLFAFILLVSSCGYNQKQEDTKDVAEEHNNEKFDNDKQEEDALFLVDAAEINLEEIQLGKLAQQKGGTAEIKELGKTIEDVHTKSQKNLSALAQSKMVTIPTTPTDDAKDAYKKLNDESGNDFDKAYANMMVSGHNDAIEIFEKASTDCNDEDIKKWATTTLPDLRSHLNRSIECQNKFKTMYLEKNN